MEKNWIKIYEIEYTSDDLSKKYKENKNTEETSMNLEDLVKDNMLVRGLKENGIPYRCKWDEKECEEQYPRWYKSRERKHFFILIYIPENYESKYRSILKSETEKDFEGIKELEGMDDEELVYEPLEKAKKVFMLIFKLFFLIALFAIIYGVTETILNQ